MKKHLWLIICAIIIVITIVSIVSAVPPEDIPHRGGILYSRYDLIKVKKPTETIVDDTEPIIEETEEVEISEPTEEFNIKNLPEYAKKLTILALIIYQEAGGNACSDETRLMVGNVFLNRVADPRFPNTFEEVATQYKQYGTLYKTGLKWPDRASKPEEQKAVQRAYRLAQELLDGKRVLPAEVIWQAEFKQGKAVYAFKDGIYFCK